MKTKPKKLKVTPHGRTHGPLSDEHKRYIETAYAKGDTIQSIADYVGKTPQYIKKFIRVDIRNITEEQNEALVQLRNREEYKQFRQEFTEDELAIFEYEYARLMPQFIEDLTPTEEDQLYAYIKVKIMQLRVGISMKQLNIQIMQTTKMMEQTREIKDIDERQAVYIKLSTDLHNCQLYKDKQANEHKNFSDQARALLKELKATREQRIKKVEAKVNFVELLKSLNQKEIRMKEDLEISIMKEAMKKEKERLSKPHTYMDGATDVPILTVETAKQLK